MESTSNIKIYSLNHTSNLGPSLHDTTSLSQENLGKSGSLERISVNGKLDEIDRMMERGKSNEDLNTV